MSFTKKSFPRWVAFALIFALAPGVIAARPASDGVPCLGAAFTCSYGNGGCCYGPCTWSRYCSEGDCTTCCYGPGNWCNSEGWWYEDMLNNGHSNCPMSR